MSTSPPKPRLAVDVLVAGMAALLQGVGVLLLFTLLVGGLLSSLFGSIGSSEVRPLPWVLFTLLALTLLLGGPAILGRYLGQPPGRALLISAVASLVAAFLVPLPTLTIGLTARDLVPQTFHASVTVLTLSLYVVLVSGIVRGRKSGSVLGCCVALLALAVLEAMRAGLIHWAIGAPQEVTLKSSWFLAILYAVAVGMAVPVLIGLFSRRAGPVWTHALPLLLGGAGVLVAAVVVTLSLG